MPSTPDSCTVIPFPEHRARPGMRDMTIAIVDRILDPEADWWRPEVIDAQPLGVRADDVLAAFGDIPTFIQESDLAASARILDVSSLAIQMMDDLGILDEDLLDLCILARIMASAIAEHLEATEAAG